MRNALLAIAPRCVVSRSRCCLNDCKVGDEILGDYVRISISWLLYLVSPVRCDCADEIERSVVRENALSG